MIRLVGWLKHVISLSRDGIKVFGYINRFALVTLYTLYLNPSILCINNTGNLPYNQAEQKQKLQWPQLDAVSVAGVKRSAYPYCTSKGSTLQNMV